MSFCQHCQVDPQEDYQSLYYPGRGVKEYMKALILEADSSPDVSDIALDQLQKKITILRYAKIHDEPKKDFERSSIVQMLYQAPLFYLPTKCALYLIDACLRQGLESMLSDHYSGWWQRVVDWTKVFQLLQNVTSQYVCFTTSSLYVCSCSIKDVELVPLVSKPVSNLEGEGMLVPLISRLADQKIFEESSC